MIIPKILETSYPYKGKIVTIRKDKLTRDGEKTFVRETAAVADSVAIVAVDDRNRVLLIRQYRHPVGEPVWEIPAGRMDIEDEKPEQTALRELQEEPPQGKFSEENLRQAQELGYTTVFWSLAYVDWYTDNQPTDEQAFSKLIPRIHNGAIVLLHSTSETNARILDELLTRWEEAGYTFGSLTELTAA